MLYLALMLYFLYGCHAIIRDDELLLIQMENLFKNLQSIGFSGSRSPSSESKRALKELLNLVPKEIRISVGCAKGVDEIVRKYFKNSNSLMVFSVASGRFGIGRSAFARRSSRCVLSVAKKGLLVALPSSSAPDGVKVSKSFKGKGSGTWGSIAFALGHGRKVLIWSEKKPPSWANVSWSKKENNWWLGVPVPPPSQLSLF